MSYNRNNNRDGGRGGSRGWGEPRPTGLASSLPAASSGKSSDVRPPGEGEDAMWSRTARSTPAKPDDNTWRSSRPAEPSSSEGPRGWGGPRRRDEPVIDDVDDKFARSFGKMSTSAPAPAPRSFDEPPRRSNPYDEPPRRTGGGFGRGGDRNLDAEINAVDDKFSRAFGGSKGNEESGDRGDRRGGFGDARREGGFGGERREGGFGGERREGGYGGPRREGGFGGERREGGFGGEGRREGGFSDARRRRDEDDGEWQNDPRFSSKFSSGGGGGGRGRGGRDRDDRERGDGYRERRPPREVDPSRFEGPLPSAPKKSLAAAANPVRAEEEAKAIEAAKQAKEEEARRAREEKEAAKAARKKAEEDAKRAKEEAKRAEEEAKNAALAAYTNAFNTTAEAIKSGLKGSALTAHLKTALVAPILPAGVLKAILASLNDDYTSVKWYGPEHFGDALKNLFPQDVPAQISLLYAVQDFCFSKKFPKITTKTGEKRLIEVLCNLLLAAEIVDMDGFIAWADDDNKLNIPGRTDAIVQTTNMVATVRAAMVEEEEEEEEDLDDYQQQYVR